MLNKNYLKLKLKKMKQLLLKLLSNTVFKKIKEWLKENGFMGFTALAVAGGAMFMGWWFVFWGSIGFFIGKNWEIIRKLWKKNVDDVQVEIDKIEEE